MKSIKRDHKFQIVESFLYGYPDDLAAVESLKFQRDDKIDISGLSYDKDVICRTNKVNSETENKAIDLVELTKKIEACQARIKIVEGCIGVLNDVEQKMIQLKYFEHRNWVYIAYNTNYSIPHIKRKRNEIIERFKKIVFGDEE